MYFLTKFTKNVPKSSIHKSRDVFSLFCGISYFFTFFGQKVKKYISYPCLNIFGQKKTKTKTSFWRFFKNAVLAQNLTIYIVKYTFTKCIFYTVYLISFQVTTKTIFTKCYKSARVASSFLSTNSTNFKMLLFFIFLTDRSKKAFICKSCNGTPETFLTLNIGLDWWTFMNQLENLT